MYAARSSKTITKCVLVRSRGTAIYGMEAATMLQTNVTGEG